MRAAWRVIARNGINVVGAIVAANIVIIALTRIDNGLRYITSSRSTLAHCLRRVARTRHRHDDNQ